MPHLDSTLLAELSAAAADVDQSGQWPQQQFGRLAAAGELGWVIPEAYGGTDISGPEMIERYRDLASSCLVTAFILTQRNGACQRIAAASNAELKLALLPDLAAGRTFATVGISHLTTSRQHCGQPAVTAEPVENGYRLNGFVPWVTGAPYAQHVVTGATLDDGRQILLALPTDLAGVKVQSPSALLSMTASATASIVLRDVEIAESHLLAGPIENVMQHGSVGGTGSLVTSALAAGLSARCLQILQDEAARRPDLTTTVESFESEYQSLDSLFQQSGVSSALVRQRANSLALRISQACLAVTKGAGFVSGHPAERAVREAMFFLVWSCPQPVVAAALEELVCDSL